MTGKRFYLDENGINDREYEFSILGEDELVNIINELNEENKELKEEINLWKSKYFDAMVSLIYEYSTNISEDIEELKKEVGDINDYDVNY